MKYSDIVQPYLTSRDGKLFDLSFSTDDETFEVFDLDLQMIMDLTQAIRDMASLLQESIDSDSKRSKQK